MVVGIDVYHDKSRKMGSIAGVVASLNDSLSRYFSTVAIQKQGQEIIDALKIAFMQSLIRYVLKVAFFRKCDEIFSDLQISKKNIPKNYPELEI